MNQTYGLIPANERDRAILRGLVADKIAQLEPLTRLGIPWRASFEGAIATERTAANGASMSERNEHLAWATAHAFVLAENA